MKVAYISHHSRPCYELEWFSLLPVEELRILDTDFGGYNRSESTKLKYCQVEYRENKSLNRLFHSTAAHVTYTGYEKYLEDVDVIIVLETFSSLSRQFVEYARCKGKKIWVLVYELIPNHPIYSIPPYRFYTKYVTQRADGFICVSERAKQHLVKQGVAGDRCHVVYPGIDISQFSPPKKRRTGHAKKVLFLAKIAPHKGIGIFLEVARRHPEHSFTVAGDGPQKDEVVAAAAALPNLTYVGRIAHPDVPNLLREHDIYIMPAVDSYRWGRKMGSEQFGFSLVEAMACGLAVVTTDCGAIGEIVTERNFVVPQHDGSAINEALDRLLKDDQLLQHIQQDNPEIVRDRYDIHQQAQKVAELWQ